MKKRTWGILACGIAACLAFGAAAYSLRGGVPVRSVGVRRQTIHRFVDEQAQTRLPHTYVVAMPMSARLAAEPIGRLVEGSAVRKGEPVACIVAEDLDIPVRQARAAVQRLEAVIAENADVQVERTLIAQSERLVEAMAETVRIATVRIDASRAGFEYAQANLARTRELRRSNARTEDEFEQAVVQHAQAGAAYRQDQLFYVAAVAMDAAAKLMPGLVGQYIDRKLDKSADVFRRQRDELQAVLDRAVEDQRRGVMLSPIDGVVLARRVSNEQFVAAGEELLRLGQPENLEVEADLLSTDAVDVAVGAPVEIYGPAIGEPAAKGTVARIYPAGFTKLSSLGVEQQRVTVIVAFNPADRARLMEARRLGAGYRVRVRITTAAKTDALVIPRSALFRGSDGRWRVFAVRDGLARERVVELGLVNDREAEVVSGLTAGDMVVDVPDGTLSEGGRVTIRDEAG